MTGLRIATDLVLPVELVTEPIGILANRGRGKSYATHVLVEETHAAGVPVVVLDVKGDWWGVRSSADGKHEGLPFYIFGGDHADLTLEPTAGELLADLVVDERVSVVLDLSHLSKTKARSFATAFSERLYHRNREPVFLVVDEADVLIPQRATAETARLLGAMEDLAKRGRGRGIGMAVVTQRPQEVAKSVLDLMETLLLLGMTGPRALKAVSEWIGVHVDEGTAASTVMANLPGMQVGEAYVWSPLHGILQAVRIRALQTFDSHPTPKVGETRRAPAARAALDLAALGERISETIERAKADDPKALRARIRDLEQQLADAQAREPEPAEPVLVHVPVVTAEVLSDYSSSADRLSDLLTTIRDELQRVHDLPEAAKQGQPTTRRSAPRATTASSITGRAPVAGTATSQRNPRPASRETRPGAGGALSKAERKILTVLAQQGTRSTTQVAILTGYSHKSGGYRNALSKLRTAGHIDGRGDITITPEGIDALGDWEPLPTGRALLDWWKQQHLGKAERAIVEVLDEHGGGPLDTGTIAELTGYSASSGGFRNALSRLRSLEIASGRGELELNPELVQR